MHYLSRPHLKSLRSVLSCHRFMTRELGLGAARAPAGVDAAVSGRAGIRTLSDLLALDPIRAGECMIRFGFLQVLEERPRVGRAVS